MKVRQHRYANIPSGIPEARELGGQCFVWLDFEAGQSVVQPAERPGREVVGIGDRRPILPGVEEDKAIAGFDDEHVDGQPSKPTA